jgi:serine/threonine-protein kinase HipA
MRFFEVNLFCFLTGNADMHLKNFSLIRTSGSEIRLSPAYDLLPTVLLLPEDTEETALTIRGRKRKLGLKDFRALGEALKLTERQIVNSLRHIERGIEPSMELIGCGFCSQERMEQYRNLLTARWQQLA